MAKIPGGTLCCACELYFSSVTAFDRHRTGPHSETIYDSKGMAIGYVRSKQRRCMNASEMLAIGMRLHNDVWHSPTNEQARLYFQNLKNAETSVCAN
jgi:hypothetical protein